MNRHLKKDIKPLHIENPYASTYLDRLTGSPVKLLEVIGKYNFIYPWWGMHQLLDEMSGD